MSADVDARFRAITARLHTGLDELLDSDRRLDPEQHGEAPVLAAWDDWECCRNPDHAGLEPGEKRAAHADDRLPEMRGSLLLGAGVAAAVVVAVLIGFLTVWRP